MGVQDGLILEVKDITKEFASENKKNLVVDHVSFSVRKNEFLVILGPGYCGKTVLLNIIMKLLKPDQGEVLLEGERITKEKMGNKFGMVFQKLGLMPWKTVMENVELGPKLRGEDKASRRIKAQKYIDLVGLTGFEDSFPHQLSGGMKQRVGIARAYANEPEILIMDEPFGQLDAQTRYNMEEELARVWEQEKRTVIFVTNNIEEAAFLGDRILLLTECPARVKEIYNIDIPRPRNMTSREFLQLRKQVSDNTDLAL